MNQARGQDTVARLLDATLACLARGGYAGLSIATITAEAGLTRGALFHHFNTKADISAHATASFLRSRHARLERLVAELEPSQHSLGARLEMLHREAEQDYALRQEIKNALRTDSLLRSLVGILGIPAFSDELALYVQLFPEAARYSDGSGTIAAAIIFLQGFAAEVRDPDDPGKRADAEQMFGAFREMFVERLSRP